MELKILGKPIFSIGKSMQPAGSLLTNANGDVITTVEDVQKYMHVFNPFVCGDNFITMFESLPEVYFPIKFITERMQNGRFFLKDIKTGEEVTTNEYINKFLTNPNPNQTFKEMMEMFFAYFYICGNSYLASSEPEAFNEIKDKWKYSNSYYVLPANYTKPVYYNNVDLYSGSDISEIIQRYELNTGLGWKNFSTNSILHSRDIKLSFDSSFYEGKSRLLSQRSPISNLLAVYEARGVIYAKKGALGAIVSKKTDAAGSVPLTPKEKEELQKQYQNDYGLSRNKSQVILSDVPVEFLRMNMSIQELQPFDETFADAVQIAGAFGIPSLLIPRKDQSTFSNQESAEVSVYDNVVIPTVNKFLDKLNTFLGIRNAGQELCVSFDHVQCLQSRKKEKSEIENSINATCQAKFKGGVITLNEWRIKIGMEAVNNPLYEKLIPLMTPEELVSIQPIINSSKSVNLSV